MRIGVTGNYSSGKSTVCSFFEELGGVIIDTDIIARKVLERGSSGLKKIIETFGEEYILPDGELDRRKLAYHVFKSEELTRTLNLIVHPLISDIVIKESIEDDRIYFINAPLLFEAKLNPLMEKNIIVVADEKLMFERGKARDNLSEEEIRDRLSRQFSVKEKIKFSDYVIYNSGDLTETRRQVEDIWKTLMSHFSSKNL
ncbi:MAG: dephospho-CoA kinase [Spirochaetes bacterium]|nr:dephospho-CoA kinase [Spirochaetota bacterium]